MGKKLSLEERFWAKVNKNGPIPANHPELGACYVWLGTIDQNGYGKITETIIDGKQIWRGAHRIAWLLEYGDFPKDGKELHHICENPSCVNIVHLLPVTKTEHAIFRKRKTHCPNGHPYDEENTLIIKVNDGSSYRGCRICTIAAATEYRRQNPEKHKASVRASRMKDPERSRALRRAYRLKNRDKINRNQQEYRRKIKTLENK